MASPLSFGRVGSEYSVSNPHIKGQRLSSAGSGERTGNLLGIDEVFLAFVFTEEGTVIDLYQLDCETADEAKARARQLAEDAVVELWDWPVRIARFTPTR